MVIENNNIKKKIDNIAFEKLFHAYFSNLCLFANKYIPDIDAAKEIVHDVYVNVWEKRDSIDASKPLKPYLFRSVHNRCMNLIRDNKKFQTNVELETIQVSHYIDEKDTLEEIEIKEKIKSAINALPEKCRQVFELNRFEEKKYSEIAEILNISIKTVEVHMSKALKKLRENLKEYITIVLFIIYKMIDKIN